MGKPSPSPSNSRRDHRRRLFRRLLTVGLLLIAVALGDNFVRRATAVNPVTDPEPGGTSGAGGGAGSWRSAKQDWSAGPGSHDSRDAHESTGERRRDDKEVEPRLRERDEIVRAAPRRRQRHRFGV